MSLWQPADQNADENRQRWQVGTMFNHHKVLLSLIKNPNKLLLQELLECSE
jgi:hypothetical protein